VWVAWLKTFNSIFRVEPKFYSLNFKYNLTSTIQTLIISRVPLDTALLELKHLFHIAAG